MSALTVPKAPISGGRAAQIRMEDNPNGAIVAQFGEKMRAVGASMENDRLSTEMGRAQVDMTKALGNLNLKYSQESDPDEIDKGWTSESAGLRKAILSRYDNKISDNVGLAFDELSARHSLSLGRRAIDLRSDRARAITTTYGETAVQQAAVSDQGTRDAVMDQYSDMLDRNVAASYMTQEEALASARAFGSDMEGVAASRMLTDNPQGLLDGLEAGEYAALDAQKRETYRTRALAAVDSAAKAAATEAGRLAKQRNTEIGDQLHDIRDIARSGRNQANEVDFLSNPDVQAHPDFAEAEAAVILRDGKPGFSRLTVAEMNEQIASEKNRPVGEKFEVRVLDAMVSVRDAAIEGWRADPYTHAAEIGLKPAPALPDYTAADPQAIASAFANRRAYALSLVEAGYMEKPVFFSPSDKADLSALASVETDPEARATLAGSIVQGFGPEATAVFSELGGDPVFAHVGGLLASGGNPDLAQEIFTGQQAIVAKTVDMPSAAESRETVYSEVSNLFAGQDAVQSSIMQATDALYAARIRSAENYDPDYSSKVYQQALHEVMGGTGKYNKNEARGGIQEVMDVETILPAGVRAKDVERAFETASLVVAPDEAEAPISSSLEAKPLNVDAWQAASSSGGHPVVNGQPIANTDLDRIHLKAIGPDRYVMVYEARTGTFVVGDSSNGDAYYFSLTKFLTEVGE